MWGTERSLADLLQQCLNRALEELDRLDPDDLLSENEDVLVSALTGRHMPRPIEIDWDGVTASQPTETSVQVRDQFRADKVHTVQASKITLKFPYSGSRELLERRATQFTMGDGADWKLQDSYIVLEIVERRLTSELVQGRRGGVVDSVGKRADWANTDLRRFLPGAEQAIRNRIGSRKQRILNDRELEAALGIPVISTGTPRQPVRAQRKQVALGRRRKNADRFMPEAALAEVDYRDVLQQVHGWARSLERSPRVSAKQDEEGLRDLLLGTLNGYWQGAAGGELFNGAGKTDILVRYDDRNVFIGELKIWRGPKTVNGTIDQLLRYLVWRDSKAAVIMFIKNRDAATIIGKLHAEVEKHPRYVLTKASGDPSKQVDYVFTADEEGRRISLAVIPVVLGAVS